MIRALVGLSGIAHGSVVETLLADQFLTGSSPVLFTLFSIKIVECWLSFPVTLTSTERRTPQHDREECMIRNVPLGEFLSECWLVG